MNEAAGVLELLELQRSADLVAKSELIEELRSRGCRISERTLTYYATEGLIPAAMRMGRRGVVYPRLAVAQLEFVIRFRDAGQTLEAIKELLPIWRLMHRGVRDKSIDLAELEFVARRHLTRTEASLAVPMLIDHVMHGICSHCREEIDWVLKDGSIHAGDSEQPLTLAFIVAEYDEQLKAGRRVAWTQLRLPGICDPSGEEPNTLVLGIPNGVPLCANEDAHHQHDRHAPPQREEVMK